MAKKTQSVGIAFPQVQFVEGGAEVHAASLYSALQKRGFHVSRINIPFSFSPPRQIVRDCLAWRLLDVSRSYVREVDILIATKFPSYVARHPKKVVYLWHQHREAYELFGSEYCQLTKSEEDLGIRDALVELDNRCLREAKAVFSQSKTVAARLKKYNGIDSKVIYPPPRHANIFKCEGYEDFFFCPGRLEKNKRVDFILDAFSHTKANVKCVVTGKGPQEDDLKKSVRRDKRLRDRVEFMGWVDEKTLVDLYSRCLGVLFAPKDEDLGFVTLDAFLSKKPVLTTDSSGAVLEFVHDGETGLVAKTDPKAYAECMDRLAQDRKLAKRLGEAGYEIATALNWDYVVDHLMSF